jgi:hypothetical protein
VSKEKKLPLHLYFKGLSDEERYFPHTLPESYQLAKNSLYHGWFIALQTSPWYKKALVTGEHLDLRTKEAIEYFGDLRKITFKKWWMDGGYEIFAERVPYRSLNVKLEYKDSQDRPDILNVQVPLNLDPKVLVSQFEELLHSIKEYKNYTPWQDSTAKVKQAKEPNVDFSRVKYLLDIYTKYIEMKKVNPDLSYADFAINQNLNPKVKIEKTDMPNEVRDKRAVLANNTDYHLSKARAIMANATVLDFPSIDEKSWICQQVLDSFDDDLKYF